MMKWLAVSVFIIHCGLYDNRKGVLLSVGQLTAQVSLGRLLQCSI